MPSWVRQRRPYRPRRSQPPPACQSTPTRPGDTRTPGTAAATNSESPHRAPKGPRRTRIQPTDDNPTTERGRRMTLMGGAAARNDEERQRVRAAMSRLRDNKAEQSNGARTVVALADESGIPRQRLYEHHSDLLNEFKATVGCGPVTPNAEALQRQLAQARDHNQELAAEIL